MDFIYRLQSFATRFLGFVVLPAQLPGDPSELLQDLLSDPLGTLKAFDWATARSLVRQIMCYEKLVVPNDSQLERLNELDYYQDRRLRALGLDPIDSPEELERLRDESSRAAGRRYEGDVDW